MKSHTFVQGIKLHKSTKSLSLFIAVICVIFLFVCVCVQCPAQSTQLFILLLNKEKSYFVVAFTFQYIMYSCICCIVTM